MKESVKFVGGFILGAGIGFVVGYKSLDKRLSAKYMDDLQREEALMTEFFTETQNKQVFKTPEDAVAALIDKGALIDPVEREKDPRVRQQKTQYNKIVKEHYVPDQQDVKNETVHQNVFQENQNTDQPYIISQDEFMANETGYVQATLTYHANGGVLTNDSDDVFEDGATVLGNDFAANFGKDSSDENTVHVRNESLQMEFEVVSTDLSYEEAVLGMSSNEAPHKRVRH